MCTKVVAGMLLFNLPADQAFIALANILNRPLPLAFFTQDEGAVSHSYASVVLSSDRYLLDLSFVQSLPEGFPVQAPSAVQPHE